MVSFVGKQDVIGNRSSCQECTLFHSNDTGLGIAIRIRLAIIFARILYRKVWRLIGRKSETLVGSLDFGIGTMTVRFQLDGILSQKSYVERRRNGTYVGHQSVLDQNVKMHFHRDAQAKSELRMDFRRIRSLLHTS